MSLSSQPTMIRPGKESCSHGKLSTDCRLSQKRSPECILSTKAEIRSRKRSKNASFLIGKWIRTLITSKPISAQNGIIYPCSSPGSQPPTATASPCSARDGSNPPWSRWSATSSKKWTATKKNRFTNCASRTKTATCISIKKGSVSRRRKKSTSISNRARSSSIRRP